MNSYHFHPTGNKFEDAFRSMSFKNLFHGKNNSRLLAGILALFLGFLGMHKFYLGKPGLGILYVIFICPCIFISWVEAICFFFESDEVFEYYHPDKKQS